MKLIVVAVAAILVSMSPCDATRVKLHRLFRASTNNHFYTSSSAEADSAAQQGYVRETSPGFVINAGASDACTYNFVVYRLYKAGAKDDHFYTNDYNEAITVGNSGYRYEGPVFRCIPPSQPQLCGATIPLRRYLRGSEHFYTADANEGNAIVAGGGKFEGILCYIWSS